MPRGWSGLWRRCGPQSEHYVHHPYVSVLHLEVVSELSCTVSLTAGCGERAAHPRAGKVPVDATTDTAAQPEVVVTSSKQLAAAVLCNGHCVGLSV